MDSTRIDTLLSGKRRTSLKISGSKVAQTIGCAPSLTPPTVRIEGDDEAALIGTAAHAILASRISGKDWWNEGGNEKVLEQSGMLAGMAWRLWEDSLSAFFPGPACEHRTPPLDAHGVTLLTGGIDLWSVVDNEIRVLDWKTGRVYPERGDIQVKAYCRLLAEEFPQIERFAGCVVHVPGGTAEWFRWTRDELLTWWESTCNWLAHDAAKEIYHPSPDNCRYCPRRLECPARHQLLEDSKHFLTTRKPGELLASMVDTGGQLLGDAAATMLGNAKFVRDAAQAAIDYMQSEVKCRGGMISMSDGRQLVIKPETHRHIEACPRTVGILHNYISIEEIENATKLSKTKIEKSISDSVAKDKGKLKKQVLDELDAAGCITETVVEKMIVTRPMIAEGGKDEI